MCTFRKATLDDLDLLVQLRHDFVTSFNHPVSDQGQVALNNYREFLQDVMTNATFVQWLAESDGEVVAYGSVNFYRLPPTRRRINGREAYIGNMFTCPNYRRKGLGSKILLLLVDEAQAANCTSVALNASEEGRALYEKFGFQCDDDTMKLQLEEFMKG
jgi:GNAT superfamily N-acetyltransferase